MNYDLRITKRSLTIVFLFSVFFSFLFMIQNARAVTFSFDAPASQIRTGDEFSVDLMLDTEKQEINAVEAKVLFPLDILELKQVSDGDSLINLWAQKSAQVSGKGEITFAGIIPGGYNGYLGKRKIISLTFLAKNNGASSVLITEAKALLNDGAGTAAAVTSANFGFSISADAQAVSSEPTKDQERPESFAVYLSKDKNIFNGKWFVVFATQDKKSGISHYEVAEDKKNVGVEYDKLNWHRAESPYVLSDQSLGDFVYVKAIDNQENEKVSVLPSSIKKDYKIYLFWSIILLIVLRLLYNRGICRRKKTTNQN